MDIVIPLGWGSPWQDNELRYCLRGIYQYLSGWHRIVIVGRLPDWLPAGGAICHLPMADLDGSRNKELNIHRKIMAAIDHGGVQGRFLFMNDDHFLLQPVSADRFPLHHKGPLMASLQATDRHNPYTRTLSNTLHAVGAKQPVNYDTHAPIVYDADTYRQVMGRLKFPPYGYALKTMYCYRSGTHGQYYPDLKLGAIDSVEAISQAVAGRAYFSIGNAAVGPALEAFMNQQYPYHYECTDIGCALPGA